MARGVEFELIGLGDLQRSLDSLSASILDRVADALDDTAHAIQAKARTKVPRDTGDLARAIQIGGKGLSLRVGLDDSAVPSRKGDSAHRHPWVYGLFVEFGLSVHNLAARPFMGPAVDEEEQAHQARIEHALDDAVASV